MPKSYNVASCFARKITCIDHTEYIYKANGMSCTCTCTCTCAGEILNPQLCSLSIPVVWLLNFHCYSLPIPQDLPYDGTRTCLSIHYSLPILLNPPPYM